MSAPPDDLTEGWPDEPGNAELARFAQELRSSRPALPEESLAWVGQTIQEELAARPRRPRRSLAYAGLAAGLLLVGLGYLLFFRPAPPPGPVVEPPRRPERIEDRYPVELAAPPLPAPPERALVRLDDYRSLFTD